MAIPGMRFVGCRRGASMLMPLLRGRLPNTGGFAEQAKVTYVLGARFYASSSDIDENVNQLKKGNLLEGKHFKTETYEVGDKTLPHPIWTVEQTEAIKISHRKPEGLLDKTARLNIKTLRVLFDVFSGFAFGTRTEKKWIRRVIFLESVAGVPGMVGAMMRHLHSLRVMRRDFGWIHTLLQEAENERMHLMTAMEVTKPGVVFRAVVMLTQMVWLPAFSFLYIVSPRYCHRFVGYLEEEAVKTYTQCLEDIDSGTSPISYWTTAPAPDCAIRYWQLEKDATLRDVILVIRADEDHHMEVNHTLASIKRDDFNPYHAVDNPDKTSD